MITIKESKTNEIYDDLYSYADKYRFTTRWTKDNVENYLVKIKRMYALSDRELTDVISKVNTDFKRKNKVKSDPYAETSYKIEKLRIKEENENSNSRIRNSYNRICNEYKDVLEKLYSYR